MTPDPDLYAPPAPPEDKPGEEWVACPCCDGRGYCLDRHDEPSDCPVCCGEGELPADYVVPREWMPCGYCDGVGRGCSYCGGEGYVYG